MRFLVLFPVLMLGSAALPATAASAMAGDVQACAAGGPAIKVRVSGFKQQRGNLRFALYDQSGWLRKGGSLKKVRVPVTGSAMDVCIAVPKPGAYGLAVHHDIDADKEQDRSDGAGFSRNPRLSLLGRPKFAGTRIEVGAGVQPISVRMLYLNGLAIGPARSS
ncbi:DUF2141 domain-containing protein [Sphingomonas sp. LHG3406-1]|uniref:DUF2141 domain-containing protein n=1 Tax=Sphingomonas sp. LHG3406-1 TaxID=2804617 RepID=UPI00260FFD5A|nr:DUF2141 domain-containing protein [Sphingomonas sp. LHG3406-1]